MSLSKVIKPIIRTFFAKSFTGKISIIFAFMRTFKYLPFYIIILIFLSTWSCKKEDLLTDSGVKIDFSTDTVLFDTVFVTIGSTTKQLLIYNRNDQKINLSGIRLAGGSSSRYRINVNGKPGISFTNIEIRAKDSLFVFIEVTIDPNNSTTPYVVTDSIIFELNGQQQDVDLVAWGQNANFIYPQFFTPNLPPYDTLPCNSVWDSVLPYVVYGYAVVDSLCSLTILPGTKVYFYNNSGLWVYSGGNLKVMGTKDHPVTFQGTRLESYYQDVPGQWDRIWINEGKGADVNEINYAIIKNGFIGLQAEPIQGGTVKKLIISNTQVKNMSGFGLLTRNYSIEAWNCVFSNCGQYLAALTNGGQYDFKHCTFANYWQGGQRGTPSLYLNNYSINENEIPIPNALTAANFGNCILYGNVENELELDFKSGADSNYLFKNTLLRVNLTETSITGPGFDSVFVNEDPAFKDFYEGDFSLDTMSFAKDKGSDLYLIPGKTDFDITGKNRALLLPPDLGAFERDN